MSKQQNVTEDKTETKDRVQEASLPEVPEGYILVKRTASGGMVLRVKGGK